MSFPQPVFLDPIPAILGLQSVPASFTLSINASKVDKKKGPLCALDLRDLSDLIKEKTGLQMERSEMTYEQSDKSFHVKSSDNKAVFNINVFIRGILHDQVNAHWLDREHEISLSSSQENLVKIIQVVFKRATSTLEWRIMFHDTDNFTKVMNKFQMRNQPLNAVKDIPYARIFIRVTASFENVRCSSNYRELINRKNKDNPKRRKNSLKATSVDKGVVILSKIDSDTSSLKQGRLQHLEKKMQKLKVEIAEAKLEKEKITSETQIAKNDLKETITQHLRTCEKMEEDLQEKEKLRAENERLEEENKRLRKIQGVFIDKDVKLAQWDTLQQLAELRLEKLEARAKQLTEEK